MQCSACSVARSETRPGADVAAVGPVPAQTWRGSHCEGCGDARRRFGAARLFRRRACGGAGAHRCATEGGVGLNHAHARTHALPPILAYPSPSVWQPRSVARTPTDTRVRTHAQAQTRTHRHTDARAHAPLSPAKSSRSSPHHAQGCAGHRRTLGGHRGRAGAARGVAQHAGARMRGCAALWHPHGTAMAYLLPHLHRGWARSLPHLHRDWAHPCHICCAGTGLTPCHICTGTGPTPATSAAPGLGSPPCHICAGGLTLTPPQLLHDRTHSQRARPQAQASTRTRRDRVAPDEPAAVLSGNARLRRCHRCTLCALRSRRAAQALHDEPDLLVDEPQSDASPADHRRRR